MTDKEMTVNENVSRASENGAFDIQQQNSERVFTQAELEKVLSERLIRERKTNEPLITVKKLLKDMADNGAIKGTSYAEMAKDLEEKLKGIRVQNGSEESEMHDGTRLCKNAEEDFPDADGEENDTLRTECGNNDVEKETDMKGESLASVLSEIKAKYPKHAVEKLFSGDLFERFAKGRNGSFMEIVDDFLSFVGSAQADDGKYENLPGYSSFTSTAFSSQSGANTESTNLTRQQMEIAKSAGMSYREYQNLLESVPKTRGRTF